MFTCLSENRIRVGYQGPPFYQGFRYHVILSNITHVLLVYNDEHDTTVLERSTNQYNKTGSIIKWGDLSLDQKRYWRIFIDQSPIISKATNGKVDF